MIATSLPIPLSDQEVLNFVRLHGKALAARLLGMTIRQLNAVLHDIAEREHADLGPVVDAGRDEPCHPEPAPKMDAEVIAVDFAELVNQLLKTHPSNGDQERALPSLRERSAAAQEPMTDGARPSSGAFQPGDEVEIIRPGPLLGKRGKVEAMTPEGAVVKVDGVDKLRLCKAEQIRVTGPVHKPKPGTTEIRRLLDVVLHGKPKAAIRAFRTLTALGEFHMGPVKRMIELAQIGRPAVAAAAGQVLVVALKAKRRVLR